MLVGRLLRQLHDLAPVAYQKAHRVSRQRLIDFILQPLDLDAVEGVKKTREVLLQSFELFEAGR
jgi:hypothetical protein